MPYRVLSIDGGGIRGLLAVVLLERLRAVSGFERLLDLADLVAGTSTGGLLALGLAYGLPLSEIRRLYVEKGPRIFDDSWLDDLVDLGRLRGAEYRTGPLRREVERLFGKTTLGELRKRVLVPAFDLDNENPDRRTWKPKLFHNFPGPNSDRDRLVAKVALYTTAAPTYFPSVDGFVDGGVYANNPSMCALAQTQDRRYRPTPALDDVVLWSLGTGTVLQYIRGKKLDWGYAQWARPLVNLMLDGTAGIADYQCFQILGARYHRLAPDFPPGRAVALDDTEQIPFLLRFGDAVDLRETIRWLERYWFSA
ncbi:MAG: patatin [Candidatus Binatia bacterium]|nr:MAG: patatin [Candidatus Binatia bacterium]